jgi:hypothetical protein
MPENGLFASFGIYLFIYNRRHPVGNKSPDSPRERTRGPYIGAATDGPDGTTIYTIAPGASAIHGSFPITSPGTGNSLLTTNASNLYVAVAAGLESYPLSAVRLVGPGGAAPALNPGVLPVYDPALSSPYLYTAVFGN